MLFLCATLNKDITIKNLNKVFKNVSQKRIKQKNRVFLFFGGGVMINKCCYISLKTTEKNKDMPKGTTNNPNGRPKGTPNKITADLREFITDLLNDNREQILKDLQAVEPHQRLLFYEKLLQYVVPKQANTHIYTGDDDEIIKLVLPQ